MCAMSPKLLRPRATGFNPRSLANIAGWWDFADSASVATVSGAISQVNDKSGLARNGTQGTANSRPSYQTAARAGRNVARFDGGDFLSLALTYSQSPFTVFVVFARTASAFQTLFSESRSTTGGYFSVALWNIGLSDALSVSRDGVGGNSNSVLSTTNDTMTIGAWASAGASAGTVSATVRRNRTQATLSTSPVPTDATEGSIGAGRNGAGAYFTGDIGEVIYYNRQLSADEIARVETYLGRKWGVTLP